MWAIDEFLLFTRKFSEYWKLRAFVQKTNIIHQTRRFNNVVTVIVEYVGILSNSIASLIYAWHIALMREQMPERWKLS